MEKRRFNYDYTKCMMMKMPMADPCKDGSGSQVYNTFADALDMIKQVDAMTLGLPKIMYLVGWQYNGHDDKYPDFFEVNEALKRDGESARDSMLWLIREARKHHTIVSVHINFNDAYENAPSFHRFVEAKALIRNKNGKPRAVERYNGRKCYKTSFVEYWESGLFREMFDRLLELLPLKEQGTVHVDNFQCYRNYSSDLTIKEMQVARRKMIDYVMQKGIDITSEFTYRESEDLPTKPFLGLPREHHPTAPMDTLGLIPASWWCTRMTREEYVTIPPQTYCGGLYKDKRYGNYLYGNIHGETIFKTYNQNNNGWAKNFLHEFAMVQAPFHFLCQFKRKAIVGHGNNERCEFEGGVTSYNQHRKITVNGVTVKEDENLLLPLIHMENTYLAYSKNGDCRTWNLTKKGYNQAEIYEITEKGPTDLGRMAIANDRIKLKLNPMQAIMIQFDK